MAGHSEGFSSPLYGTATFTQLSTPRFSDISDTGAHFLLSIEAISSVDNSDTERPSSDGDDATSTRQMRRVLVSPIPPEQQHGGEAEQYNDDDSFDETAEVENALNVEDELDDTEDFVARWSGGTSAMSPSPSTFNSVPGSYSTRSPSYTSTSSTGLQLPFFSNNSYAGRILSMITERTESTSRPASGVPRPDNVVQDMRRSAILSGAGSPSPHVRSSTDPAADRALLPPGRRAGDLIAFFEDKKAEAGGHSRTVSAPGGPRSPSPYLAPASQSTPNFGSSTGYGTGFGYSNTGYGSRSGSPAKSKSGSSVSSASSASVPISTLLSPPLRGFTSTSATETRTRTGGTFQSPNTFTNTYTDTFSNTFTPTDTFTGTATFTGTPTASPLRRPQTSPRSPLTSVRNIVAAWKERTPLAKQSPKSPVPGSVTSSSPPPDGVGHVGLRRRPGRIGTRARGPTPQSLEDAPFDVTDLTPYTKGNAKVSCLFGILSLAMI